MPLIVDANRAGDFSAPLSGYAQDIFERIRRRRIRIALGGRLKIELSETKFRDIILLLKSIGCLDVIDDDEVNILEIEISESGDVTSNDAHVLALTKLSNARCIYTEDRFLIDDLHNPRITGCRRAVLTTTTPAHHARRLLERCRNS